MKIQKKTVTLSKYNAHTEPIFKTLKLLKINDIFKCQTLKFCYKLLNGNLPAYFNYGDWYSPISNIHCYSTRRQNNLFTYGTNHQFAKRCLRLEVVITFTNTPLSIFNKIHAHYINGFSLYLKTHLLPLYIPLCNITNCYVCRNNIYWDQGGYLQLPHWLFIFTNVILIIIIDCYSAYIWIYIKNKLSQDVEGGSYDCGNVALVCLLAKHRYVCDYYFKLSYLLNESSVGPIRVRSMCVSVYTYMYMRVCMHLTQWLQ